MKREGGRVEKKMKSKNCVENRGVGLKTKKKTLRGGEYGYFLEQHNLTCHV